MRNTFQRLFLLFLPFVAGLSVAGTVTTLDEGTHTLETGSVYLMSAAGATGVTREWTLTATGGTAMNVALRVNLGAGNNTIILNLNSYAPVTTDLQDDNDNYVPPLKVLGKGTLIIRHTLPTSSVCLRVKDSDKGRQPVIDLSEMTGGEVRFERAKSENATTWIYLQRVWACPMTTNDFSAGTQPTPVVIGNSKVCVTFAEGVRVRFQASACVVKSSRWVLPELISEGCQALRVEEGAVVNVYPYGASAPVKEAGYNWTMDPLFPTAITLAGGCVELEDGITSSTTLEKLIDIPSERMDEVVAATKGQGEVFGKRILALSAKSSVVPEACFKVADDQTLEETERTTDENGRLVIDAAKVPELVYASGVSESDRDAAILFGLIPTVTESGCTVNAHFGIADLKVDQADNTDLVSTLKVSVDLPTETAQSRSFYLRVLQTSPGGTVSTIYPATGTAALTTFTREAADSSRFSASIPCRITPSRGTTSITVRAYSTPPTK